ncbi:MAG: bifunctional diaminohydroxyphosphoribosylaminopyrimidine deaminase/5-amino-6-(5-phosphoribosylamino)uracil reductase RibD [Planctomycetes bacterium]|nr:bifunctional diaminohydroxyphosphoribosylaminopyrimidine deaminase/5-amino-6-(5-phosphoribosylamino)uracil reductase RibD [Planctomycetota bacterium]MBL7038891.1 bifunctional diaminohydroxyphosphoribosylaminopyrimidine deaminase/5-amino-6-(5-phosphoribosylamino)uracil reductase RibD [Pirellulaceae bacterium]
MARALQLAARGGGHVEPNPMVGCVIADDERVVGEGWHGRYGGPHAEVEAIRAAGDAAAGATMYVTLEPCCHQGKTPPCTDAVIESGVRRVVVGGRDPFREVDGGGIARLTQACLEVDVGLNEREAAWLNAPYLKLVETGRPWILAKWAMTLDGKSATRTGNSQWISGESSRRVVHEIRGRMDAIMVGRGTALADDPLLTARPAGARTATRVVVDSQASLAPDSQLVDTIDQAPVLVACSSLAPDTNRRRLADAGCEVWVSDARDPSERLLGLLDELGRRRMTNVLIEGGGQLAGSLFDAAAVDEVHVFIANKLVGGADAPTPLAGTGIELMSQAVTLYEPTFELLDGDIYQHGRTDTAAERLFARIGQQA